MALPSHQCRLGARYFTLSVIVAVAIALFVYQWLPAPPPASAAPLAATPALVFSSEAIPDSIALGESFDLEFQIGLMSGTGGHGGISVSFPDLTARGGSSSSYDSVQGTVTTVSYTNGISHVAYFDEGDQIFKGNDANRSSADNLLVESDDDDWPSRSADGFVLRTLKLRVTPKESGPFRIYSRFWLCGSGYEDCDRRPRPEHSDQEDQQRWSVFEDTVRVSGPTSGPFSRNSAEDFDGLDEAGNDSPAGIWSDGTTMWVADSSDDKIYAYNLSTKARDSSKDFDTLDAADNESPTGIWSDGTTMWVADSSDDKIYAYNMSDKARVSSKDFDTLDDAGNGRPEGIWSDGATMWVADSSDDKIYAYNMSDKARVSSKDFDTLDDAGNGRPEGIWSDGTTMWVADYSDDNIYAYNLSTKARDSSKDFDTLDAADNESPTGIWSDRTTMWVADYSDEKIYAYNAPETAVSGANGAPTVSRVPSSPSQVSLFTGDRHTFTASATDPDDNLTSWDWSVDGTSEDSGRFGFWPFYNSPTGTVSKSFSHTFSTADTYTVEATFTDKDDLSGSVSWSVTVTDNRAPTVTGTPSTQQTLSLTTGDSQTFGVSATDPDGNMTKWEWEASRHRRLLPDEKHTEPEESFAPAGDISKSFSYTFATAGDWTVTATFTDSKGETGSASWTVAVEDPSNRTPSVMRVSPGATDVVPTGDVTFTVNADDPDNNLKRYEWSVDGTSEDSGSWLLFLPTGTVTKSFTHTFATAGTYTVEAVFTDDEGLSAAIRWTITVVNPVTVQLGAATYAVNEDDGEVDVTVTISASPYRALYLDLTTSDGTAESQSDYGYSRHFVSFSRGTTTLTQTFTVTIADNSYVEPTETFTVELNPGFSGLPIHMSVARSEATVTIHDDDEATVQFSRGGLTIRESDIAFESVLEVESHTPSGCPVDAPFGVQLSHLAPDGTSSSGPSVPSSVMFQHCHRARNFTVDIQDLSGTGPGVLTGTTEVVFTLDGVSSASPGVVSRVRIGEVSTQTVTIQDNDEAHLRFKSNYLITREREQIDICVLKAGYPSVRIARPFTAHFSYSDPDGVLTTGSTVPSSVTLDAGDTEGCATVHVGDVDQAGTSVSFTLDRVTSTGSDVASRVVISGYASELEVRVEDRDGLARPVAVTVESDPTGLTVTVDGTDTTTPYTDNWATGSSHALDAPSPQTVNQNEFVFSGWSDGLAQSHSVSPTADTTYTAYFTQTTSGGTPAAEITSCGASPTNPTVRHQWKPVAEVTNHSYSSLLSKEFLVKFTVSDPVRGLELPETESTTKTWIQIGDSYAFEGPAASWPEDEKEQRAEDRSYQLPLYPLNWFPGEIVVECELKARDRVPPDELVDKDTGTVTIPDFQRGSPDAKITESDGVTTCAPVRRPVLSGEAPTLQANTTYIKRNKGLRNFAVEYWVHHDGLRVHHSGGNVKPNSSTGEQNIFSREWGTEELWERPEDRIDLDSRDLPLGTYTLDCALWGHLSSPAYKRLMPGNRVFKALVALVTGARDPIGFITSLFKGPMSPDAEIQRIEREFSHWLSNKENYHPEDYSLQGLVSTEFTVVEARWGMDGLSIERGIEPPPDSGERISVRVYREETKNREGGRIRAPKFHIEGPELDQVGEATLCENGSQDHTNYLSRCWERTFVVPVNDTREIRNYTVETQDLDMVIEDEQVGSFAVEASPDAAGLEAFYNALGGPSWVNKDGWLSGDPIGEWYGVETNNRGRVTRLDFRGSDRRGNGLQGQMPEDLKDILPLKDHLPELQTLYLEGNGGFANCVPESLYDVQNNDLRELGLPACEETCAWGAALPDPADSGLVADCEALLAARNSLTAGRNSDVLDWSTRMPIGDWSGVYLGGSPQRVTRFETTQELWGYLSAELGKLSNLEVLNLSYTFLRGRIPEELEDLANLHTLNLGGNRLEGGIPPELARLTNLQTLDLSDNDLRGRIPRDLGDLVNLRTLDLSDNDLSGPIPENLAGLGNLQSLNLSGNGFAGCIPHELRRVAVNDFGDVGLPFCDVMLSGLTISPGTLLPEFEPGGTEYTADVGSSSVTITPTNDHNAQLAYLDENDAQIPDADGAVPGHQVPLDEGGTTIKVRVTSRQDGSATRTYIIVVSRVGLPSAPSMAGPITPGAASLSVSWTAPSETGGAVITSYDLRYIESSAIDKADTNWNVVEGAWDTGPTTYTVFGLDSGTQYDVQVRAASRVGAGPWSATLTGTPSAGGCSTGGAVAGAVNNPALVADCEVLLEVRDTLAGTASLDWLASTSIGDWDGVTLGGTPRRVTGLNLANRRLTGSIAVALGSLAELQSLLLSNNQLTGEIPGELARLSNLQSLTLSQNQLAGCIPENLRSIASNDLASVGLPFCDAILSGLTISPGTLIPQFEPGRTGYTADVEPSQITITPINDHNATFQFLNENDAVVQDADAGAVGQQVELGYGITTIKIKVISQDTEATHTYTIEVTRIGMPGAPSMAGPITPGAASLSVSWTAPSETGGAVITSYDLRYIESSAADKADTNWSVVEGAWDTGPTTYTVFGLDSGTQYDVQVRAASRVGAGPWSATLTGTPSAGGCSTGGAVTGAVNNPGLVADCEVLLEARDILAGTASLDWLAITPVGDWSGITLSGTPQRVTGLDLTNMQLTGSISAALGSLIELQSLLLSNNQLTGEIPRELARLSNLSSMALSQNQLDGCIPEGLRDVASNDLTSLGLPFCDVLLSGLTINPGTLTPEFQSSHTDYAAEAGQLRITVVPTNDHNATFQFLDENDAGIPDADGALDGHQVDLGNGITTIKVKVTSQDNGASHTYTIRVTTTVGLPGAPEITGPITPGAASLTVSWTAPPDGTVITSYDLRYIESSAVDKADANWTVVKDTWTTGSLIYTIEGLTGGAQYDVQVRAVSSVGAGPWSATSSGVPQATPGAPAIGLLTSGDSALTVEWSAPATDGGSDVTGYDLRYIRSDALDKADGNWTVRTGIWISGNLRYNLDGLTNGVAYDIQVRAVNVSGTGPWSERFTGTPATWWAIRSLSPESVEPGGEVEVTITATGYGTLGGQVVEILPDGFSYVGSDLDEEAVAVVGQAVTFTLFGTGPTTFTYTVTASSEEGTYSFSGVLRNEDLEEQPVGGASTIAVTTDTAPEFPATETGERSVLESAPESAFVGDPVAATGAGSEPLAYTLGGDDAALFAIDASTGQIRVRAGTTLDPDIRDTYTVVVTATGTSGASADITVTIMVVGLLTQYDSDSDGSIGKGEAIEAIVDYFAGRLTKGQTIAVIVLYFSSGN